MPFQRRIVDFGADIPFGQISVKLKEHYGIEAAQSTLRLITLRHANKFKQKEEGDIEQHKILPAKGCIISETDGCMIPIVKTLPKQPGNQNRRKKKQLLYKEARLTLSHEKGSVSSKFSATMGSVEKMGQHIRHCVELIGLGEDTKIHCVGDGASWIAGQVEEQFGTQATYLIDFYHLCEYLAAASKSLKEDDSWIERQKRLLKENKANQILKGLAAFIEDESIPDADAPVRVCSRYLSNRLQQLDYRSALENDLPIGSGEIESAHRYIIQARLKRPGAWWLDKHAEDMMTLRTQRANQQWDTYWKSAA